MLSLRQMNFCLLSLMPSKLFSKFVALVPTIKNATCSGLSTSSCLSCSINTRYKFYLFFSFLEKCCSIFLAALSQSSIDCKFKVPFTDTFKSFSFRDATAPSWFQYQLFISTSINSENSQVMELLLNALLMFSTHCRSSLCEWLNWLVDVTRRLWIPIMICIYVFTVYFGCIVNSSLMYHVIKVGKCKLNVMFVSQLNIHSATQLVVVKLTWWEDVSSNSLGHVACSLSWILLSMKCGMCAECSRHWRVTFEVNEIYQELS